MSEAPEWSVHLETPNPKQTADAMTPHLETMLKHLRRFGAIGTLDDHTLGITLTVKAATAEKALQLAKGRLLGALLVARIPMRAPLVRIEVIAQRVLMQENDRGSFPGLVGVAEAAAMLGVSKQRISELARTRGFPSPAVRLAAGPVWLRSSIEQFVGQWPRKAGWAGRRNEEVAELTAETMPAKEPVGAR